MDFVYERGADVLQMGFREGNMVINVTISSPINDKSGKNTTLTQAHTL